MIPAEGISARHKSVDSFIHQCGSVEDVHQSRAPLSEAIVYKKLARVPQHVPGSEDELMAKIFDQTRFDHWVVSNTQETADQS
jgi:hypothetical protein